MMSNYLPIPDVHLAPPIIQELRTAFDDRLEFLHAEAMRLLQQEAQDGIRMVHVPFPFGNHVVEAMYDREQDLFTQLVARPLADSEQARPSYTISLFLVTP